jgi:hypothetical protein
LLFVSQPFAHNTPTSDGSLHFSVQLYSTLISFLSVLLKAPDPLLGALEVLLEFILFPVELCSEKDVVIYTNSI